MKKLLSLVLLLGLISFTGCDDDEKVDSCAQLEAVTTAVLETALTYAFDESVANCEAYAEALQEYLDVAKNCDQVDQETIDQTESDLEDLDCSAIAAK